MAAQGIQVCQTLITDLFSQNDQSEPHGDQFCQWVCNME